MFFTSRSLVQFFFLELGRESFQLFSNWVLVSLVKGHRVSLRTSNHWNIDAKAPCLEHNFMITSRWASGQILLMNRLDDDLLLFFVFWKWIISHQERDFRVHLIWMDRGTTSRWNNHNLAPFLVLGGFSLHHGWPEVFSRGEFITFLLFTSLIPFGSGNKP